MGTTPSPDFIPSLSSLGLSLLFSHLGLAVPNPFFQLDNRGWTSSGISGLCEFDYLPQGTLTTCMTYALVVCLKGVYHYIYYTFFIFNFMYLYFFCNGKNFYSSKTKVKLINKKVRRNNIPSIRTYYRNRSLPIMWARWLEN